MFAGQGEKDTKRIEIIARAFFTSCYNYKRNNG